MSVPKVISSTASTSASSPSKWRSHRAHKFTRVGGDFFLKCEGQLKAFIRSEVQRHPSVGKTIK